VIKYDSLFAGLFAQDTWKPRRNLTVTYGLRYDVYRPPEANREAPFAYSQKFRTDKSNFAPRLGIAWSLGKDQKTVIRANGGIFFGLGSGAVTTAFATEPFPTYVRGRAATWCRNAFEVPAAVLAPVLIGFLGDPSRHLVGSIGNAMTLLFPICVIPVIFITARYLPETKDVNFVEMDARASEIGSIRNGDSQVS
jgi:hypothetical protein